MGNDESSAKGHTLGGASSASSSAPSRQQAVDAAAGRVAQKRPTGKSAQERKAEHMQRYAELDKGSSSNSTATGVAAVSGPKPQASPKASGNVLGSAAAPKAADAGRSNVKSPASNLSPTVLDRTASDTSANDLECPLCHAAFDTEAAVYAHFERTHGDGAAAGAPMESERELRARVAELRLKSKQSGSKANKQALKDSHWERYTAISSKTDAITAPSDNQKSEAEIEQEIVVTEAIKAIVTSFLGSRETLNTSFQMIVNILQKLSDPSHDQFDKYRRINLSHEKVKALIVQIPGAMKLLQVVGFRVRPMLNAQGVEEECLYFDNEPSSHSAARIAITKLTAFIQQSS